MGSAKCTTNTSILNVCKYKVQALFQKDKKKKSKHLRSVENEIATETVAKQLQTTQPVMPTSVLTLMENKKKQSINRDVAKKKDTEDCNSVNSETDNGIDVDSRNIVKNKVAVRYTSNSSNDSGFDTEICVGERKDSYDDESNDNRELAQEESSKYDDNLCLTDAHHDTDKTKPATIAGAIDLKDATKHDLTKLSKCEDQFKTMSLIDSDDAEDTNDDEQCVVNKEDGDAIKGNEDLENVAPESTEDTNGVAEALENLKIGDNRNEEHKKKRVQNVFVPRRPVRPAVTASSVHHPYHKIHQVNKQSFSGGQLIIKGQDVPHEVALPPLDGAAEINRALSHVEVTVDMFNHQYSAEDRDLMFQVAEDYVADIDLLSEFGVEADGSNDAEVGHGFPPAPVAQDCNPLEEFNSNTFDICAEDADFDYLLQSEIDLNDHKDTPLANSFLTPPRSNEGSQFSPNAALSPSFYSPHSNFRSSIPHSSPQTDYTYSPDHTSSNFNSDQENEKIQELDDSQFPICINENYDANSGVGDKGGAQAKEKVRKSSSISMKSIKESQMELQGYFAKQQCCKKERVCAKRFFQEHISKLTLDQRKTLCLKIAKMDFKTAYGVLHHVVIDLYSGTCEQKAIRFSTFYLICEKILAQQPDVFLSNHGFNLLAAATLRCPSHPELVRMLVRTIRSALRTSKEGELTPETPVFAEVDSRCDSLLGACARAGDTYADVLAELVVKDPQDRPLFDVGHTNTDGYSALHLACLAHNGPDVGSCLRTVHVLVAHAHADLYQGDNKAGDTAMHLAVRSVTCDLKLVQALLLYVHRGSWKTYVHTLNRSSASPLVYARRATKSSGRQNYPVELLDMLKKFR